MEDKMEDIMTREAAEKIASQILVKKTTEAVYDHCSKQEKAITEFVNKNCEAVYEDGKLREYRIKHQEGTFMWAVKQMMQTKKVRIPKIHDYYDNDNLIKFSIYYAGGNVCKKYIADMNKEAESTAYNFNMREFEATDWEVFEEESEYEGMSIGELIHQAHMKGQMDYGCKSPGYSNAQADCKEIVEVAKKFAVEKEGEQDE